MTLTRRSKKWLLITTGVLVVTAFVVAFLPEILRRVAINQIGAATGRTVAIEDVDLNLFTGRAVVKSFSLADRARSEALVQFKEVSLKLHYLPLFSGHLKLAELNLSSPTVNLVRTGPTEFNFSDLLRPEKKEPPKTAKGGFDLTVDRFKLSNGVIILEDSAIAPARTWKAEGLNFDVANISTRAGGPAGRATIDVTLAGTPISLKASDLRLTPTHGRAALNFEGFDLSLLLPYVPSDSPVMLQGGRLSAALTLNYGSTQGTQLDGDVRLGQLAVLQHGRGRPFLAAPELRINVKNINVNNGVLNVGAVEISGDPTLIDTSLSSPPQFQLSKLKISVEKLAWPQNEPALLRIHSELPKGGAVDVGGTILFKPLKAELRLQLKDADLSAYRRYIPISAPLSGKAETDLALAVSMDGAFEATVNGKASLRRVVLGPPKDPVVSIEQVSAAAVDVRWPSRIKVGEVRVRKPSALIERAKDGTLPLRAMFSPPSGNGEAKEQAAAPSAAGPVVATAAAKPGSKPQTPKMAIEIGEIVVEEGFARFTDHTGDQPYTEELSRLAMNIKGLSNAPGKRGKLTLQSVIGATGALDLRGEIAPLAESLWIDLEGELRDFAIPRVNPYTDRLLSWIARDGRLGTKVHFRVDGDKIDVTSEIVVGRLDLVQASADDKAKEKIGLPLGLIVSLMKDARGEIRVNVPVSGNLSAPEFSFGQAIWTAVNNMLVNVLAAPFRAIGRLFTAGDKITGFSIDPVGFEPGSAALTEATDEQLKRLNEFLRNSPFVRLSLSPVLSETDFSALKTREVTARLQAFQREQKLTELAPAAQRYFRLKFPNIKTPETVEGIVAVLRDAEPRPEAEAQKLAQRRVEVVSERLSSAGTDTKRLASGGKGLPPDAKGDGRVEFSIAP